MKIAQINDRGESHDFFGNFREETYRRLHEVLEGAPDEWAATRGATHTLHMPHLKGGPHGTTRPAKVGKTRVYIGVDEDDNGQIVWETWRGRWIK